MDFESGSGFDSSDVIDQSGDGVVRPEAHEPEENKYYQFLEEQGYTINRDDAASVLSAIGQLRQTEAFNAAPPGIEDFEQSLRVAPKVEVLAVDPERLEKIATWLRSQGSDFSGVTAENPRSVIDAFKIQKARETRERALAEPGIEIDYFYDAPVGMEKDIEALEAAA